MGLTILQEMIVLKLMNDYFNSIQFNSSAQKENVKKPERIVLRPNRFEIYRKKMLNKPQLYYVLNANDRPKHFDRIGLLIVIGNVFSTKF